MTRIYKNIYVFKHSQSGERYPILSHSEDDAFRMLSKFRNNPHLWLLDEEMIKPTFKETIKIFEDPNNYEQ